MSYLLDLLDEYPPRFVKKDELRKGDKVLQPFDYVSAGCWRDLQKVCSDTHAHRDVDYDNPVKRAANSLNPTFLACRHDASEKLSYRGSIMVMLPYDAEVEHKELMDVAVRIYRERFYDEGGAELRNM